MNLATQYSDDELNEIGRLIANCFGAKRDPEHSDRFQTAIGTKTGKGIVLTLATVFDILRDGGTVNDIKARVL